MAGSAKGQIQASCAVASRRIELACPECGVVEHVPMGKVDRTSCEPCGVRMTRAAAADPATLKCPGCGAKQHVANPRQKNIKCLGCGTPLTADMAMSRKPKVASTPAPPQVKPSPNKPSKSKGKGKKPKLQPGPSPEPAERVEHEIDLVCETCDVLRRGKLSEGHRCDTPRCNRRPLVAASSLPGRRPWEKELPGGAFGQGKRR